VDGYYGEPSGRPILSFVGDPEPNRVAVVFEGGGLVRVSDELQPVTSGDCASDGTHAVVCEVQPDRTSIVRGGGDDGFRGHLGTTTTDGGMGDDTLRT